MPIRRVIVHGRVQGVGYRAWTVGQARGLGLTGWVRNLPDGSVEAVFSGGDEAVRRMIDGCRKGPRAAKVTWVDESASEETEMRGFESR